MTYKEIINRFRQVTSEHMMLKDFGYGQLSDLKTQSQLGPEEQGVDYPYLFLLPGQSNRQNSVMNYQFNMIIMDMARGEEGDEYDNYISIQSQCQQYIDDVLARLYFYYTDQPEITLTGITYTPFKEKYQDELAGMTATITIQVPQPLNACAYPYFPTLLVDYAFDPNFIHEPDPAGQGIRTLAPASIGTEYWFNGVSGTQHPYRGVYMPQTGVYEVVVTGTVTQLEAKPLGRVLAMDAYLMDENGYVSVIDADIPAVTSSGWPQGESIPGDYQWTSQYIIDTTAIVPTLLPGQTIYFGWLYKGVGPEDESTISIPSSTIKISLYE